MLSPYTQDQILAITRINGFKIYTVFEKINHWVDNYLRNWAVCSENYPLMSLPMHLDTQDQETVNQHLYWQARGSVLKRRRGGSNNKSEQTRNEERSDDSWCQSTADLESVQSVSSVYSSLILTTSILIQSNDSGTFPQSPQNFVAHLEFKIGIASQKARFTDVNMESVDCRKIVLFWERHLFKMEM